MALAGHCSIDMLHVRLQLCIVVHLPLELFVGLESVVDDLLDSLLFTLDFFEIKVLIFDSPWRTLWKVRSFSVFTERRQMLLIWYSNILYNSIYVFLFHLNISVWVDYTWDVIFENFSTNIDQGALAPTTISSLDTVLKSVSTLLFIGDDRSFRLSRDVVVVLVRMPCILLTFNLLLLRVKNGRIDDVFSIEALTSCDSYIRPKLSCCLLQGQRRGVRRLFSRRMQLVGKHCNCRFFQSMSLVLSDEDVVNQGLKCLREGLLPAMLQLPISQILMQLNERARPLFLLWPEARLKIVPMLLDEVEEYVKASAN